MVTFSAFGSKVKKPLPPELTPTHLPVVGKPGMGVNGNPSSYKNPMTKPKVLASVT
jgi:hypothetical protein